MDLHERLYALIFPEAVSSGCFGDDVQKFVSFKTHERKGIINFCSQIIFGEVILERQAGGRFSQSVVIKTQNRQPSADSLAMFHNEVLFYAKIVPLFQKYDKERFLFTSLPKFVYGKATNGRKPNEDIIIFKGLAQDGFKPSENPYFLNEKHIELVLDRLGKYHALSFMCKFDDPVGFEEISTQILKLSSFPLDFAFPTKKAFRHSMLRGIEPLEGDPKYRAELAKLCANIDTVRGRMDGYVVNSGPLTVVAHGDFHPNNMMFKYDAEGEPVEVTFYDFAMIRLCSPAIDTSLVLFSSTVPRLINIRWDDLLNLYHSAVSCQMDDYCASRPRPSPDAVKLDIKNKGIYSFYYVSFVIPNFMSILSGGTLLGPPNLEDLDEVELEIAVKSYIARRRELGGAKETELLTEITRLMLDENFTFEY